jgi:transcriptional regulator with PAS, ATPase and Fis domain
VLLTGESGTGKELAALELHRMGQHAEAPFVPVSCATTAPQLLEAELFGTSTGAGQDHRDGLFVYAQGGTLFFDEISELAPPLQATLLRALETRRIRPLGGQQEIPVDLRIIAATSRPLREEVQAGRFRKDLYYRLQVVEINLPPLRRHAEDIPDLVEHFLDTLAPQLGRSAFEITSQEMRFLQEHDWPGNVRELRNLIERSLIVGALNVSALYQSTIRFDETPPSRMDEPQRGAEKREKEPVDLQTLEKRHILSILDSVAGDKTRAAQLLGVSRRTLERRVAEWGLG